MNNTISSSCVRLTWSEDTADARAVTFYICIVAVVIHFVFWVQLLAFSSVRQKEMIWLYIYLITDLLLLFRFFLLYGQRKAGVCVPTSSLIILCYFEATFKIYLDMVQSYLLLAMDVCRYAQIVFNRNVYTKNPRLVILTHLFIYIFPVFTIVIQFVASWTQLWRTIGGLCDIQYTSLVVQVVNLVIIYVIPVSLNLVFLSLCIRHVSSIKGIRNQQIINNRRKQHRTLLTQSIAFYSIWLALWSPYMVLFPFVNVNSNLSIATSILNYMQVALDPAIVALVDVRFFKAWKTTWSRIRRHRQRQIVPFVAAINRTKY